MESWAAKYNVHNNKDPYSTIKEFADTYVEGADISVSFKAFDSDDRYLSVMFNFRGPGGESIRVFLNEEDSEKLKAALNDE